MVTRKNRRKVKAIQTALGTGRLMEKDKFLTRLYRWIDNWNMGKFFDVTAEEGVFCYQKNEAVIATHSQLDGCYVIVTNMTEDMTTKEVVSHYKSLSQVEQVFRHMKTTDIRVRPIRRWNAQRVKGHLFVCMLAYLVVWHCRKQLSSFLDRNPKTQYCEGKSLREIWDTLAQVKLGTLKMGKEHRNQLSLITAYQHQLLKALNAPIKRSKPEALSLRI